MYDEVYLQRFGDDGRPLHRATSPPTDVRDGFENDATIRSLGDACLHRGIHHLRPFEHGPYVQTDGVQRDSKVCRGETLVDSSVRHAE